MSLWAFRFILWYVCILLVQPQNRFLFLWPLRMAYVSFLIGAGLHIFSCLEKGAPLLRMGPATVLALLLLMFAGVSQQVGVFQVSSAWNPWLDIIVKNSLLLIMVEVMCTSVERVWAVQMTALICTLWWVKAGIQLIRAGATTSGDRLMGAAVSLIENPNGFAYMMCVFLPLYLYAYQQATKKWMKLAFLVCALYSVFIVFETGSRTGLITLIAVGAFLLPHYGRNQIKSLLLIAIAIAFIYPQTSPGNKKRFQTIPQSMFSFLGIGEEKPKGFLNQDEQSADERKRKNIDTWALIKEYPAFGVGVNPNDGLIPEKFAMAKGQVHCEILAAGKQMGFIGMGLYVGFLCTIFFSGLWVRRHAKHWPAVQDLGWTFQVQAIAIAIGGYFCPGPWHPPMMMFAGSASALVRILKEENERRAVRY